MRYAIYREGVHDWRIWLVGLSGSRMECVALFRSKRAAQAFLKRM